MGDPAENEDAVIIRMPKEDWIGPNGRSKDKFKHEVYIIQSVGDIYLDHWMTISSDGRIDIIPRIWDEGKFRRAEDSAWQSMTPGRRSGWPGRGR